MTGNGGPWGSISRVFSRASKQRKNLDLSIYEGQFFFLIHLIDLSAVRQTTSPRDYDTAHFRVSNAVSRLADVA